MTETTMPLIELLRKHDEGDFLRAVSEVVLQLLMEHDVKGLIGAGPDERAEGRLTYRNNYRDCKLKTRLGSLKPCAFPLGPNVRLSSPVRNLADGRILERYVLGIPKTYLIARSVDRHVLATAPDLTAQTAPVLLVPFSGVSRSERLRSGWCL